MWYLLTCEYLKAHMHLKSLGVSQYTGLAGWQVVRRSAVAYTQVRIITV